MIFITSKKQKKKTVKENIYGKIFGERKNELTI